MYANKAHITARPTSKAVILGYDKTFPKILKAHQILYWNESANILNS